MTAGNIPALASADRETLTSSFQCEVRDAVLVFRPCPSTLRELANLAPDPSALALLCIQDLLADLQECVGQTDFGIAAQSIVFFYGGLGQSLRSFPLRWQLAFLEGPAERVQPSELGELADSLASDGKLVWFQPDSKARGLLDNLVATRAAQIDDSHLPALVVLRFRKRYPPRVIEHPPRQLGHYSYPSH